MYGDITDSLTLESAFHKAWPDEFYNLAGQVFVPVSWGRPRETLDANAGAFANILDMVSRIKPDTKVYQASTSEMFGNSSELDGTCCETTKFVPESPYGVSKYASHLLCDIYRRKGLAVWSGILFNHESPRRGTEMVTRKIAKAIARWVVASSFDKPHTLQLGNLDSGRDWGFAGDYVRAMHAMLQVEPPQDYVIGTGKTHTIRDFINIGCQRLEDAQTTLDWPSFLEGHGMLVLSKHLQRKNEVKRLCADATKARMVLGWKPSVSFTELVDMMVQAEVEALNAKGEAVCA